MARGVLFWHGMRKSIPEMWDTCGVCAQYGKTFTKEPMKSLPIPSLPWEIINQDLFTLEQRSFLATVCHFSDWIEVDELTDTLSETIVNKTKTHFARYGIPRICHTDNGPQFESKTYNEFATEYGFKHTTSSPYHPQGNGRAEAAVKIAKNMMKKSDDFQCALLHYRNTPPKGHTYSPAQRMLCRRTRTKLPTSNNILRPKLSDRTTTQRELNRKRATSKLIYDRTVEAEHSTIRTGQYVYAKPSPHLRGKPWIYGQVMKEEPGRSYTIKTFTETEEPSPCHTNITTTPTSTTSITTTSTNNTLLQALENQASKILNAIGQYRSRYHCLTPLYYLF